MAEGHDGFAALQRGKPLIDDEGGQIYSAIVRKYLMGKINCCLEFTALREF
jgi:hypothetical protein